MNVSTEKGPPPVMPLTLRQWREQVLNGLLRGALIFATLALVGGIINALQAQRLDLLVTYLMAYTVLILATFVRRVSFALRAGALLGLLYGLGALGLSESGLSGDGRVFLLTFVVITAILFDMRRSIGALVFSLLTMATVAGLLITGQWEISIQTLANSTDPTAWFSGSVVNLLLSVVVVIPVVYLIRGLDRSLVASQDMVRELQTQQAQLEQLVQERTADLERRAAYLQASAEVGYTAASILDTDQLICQVVELMRERFDLCYVGAFRVDASGEWAVLQAASGEVECDHRIKIGEGVIGWSIANAETRVALRAEADTVQWATPKLPPVRSEAALPLRSRGRVLGALTVQSVQPDAFDQDLLTALQTMVDQVAVALDNARLFAESEAALEATRHAYGELSQRAWSELLRTSTDWGYCYEHQIVTPARGGWPPEMRQALLSGQSVQRNSAQGLTLEVPLKIRDQTIGVLSFHKESASETWTTEEITLLETLTGQLEQALESARLYQATQRRAERERLVGAITTRMRETLDIDTVLQTAVHEIRETLGLTEAEVWMGIVPAPDDNGSITKGKK
jgi:GAF domain-containing protein